MKTKVLIPVDTSRNSMTAEEYAVKLSWRIPLAITLLNVVDIHRIAGHGISPVDQDRIKSAMVLKSQRTLELAAEPFSQAGLEHEIRIEEGRPGLVICKVAQDEGFDMVIIPQSGLTEWEEILGGSVVRQVLTNCRIPVLLVKHSSEQLQAQRRPREKGRSFSG